MSEINSTISICAGVSTGVRDNSKVFALVSEISVNRRQSPIYRTEHVGNICYSRETFPARALQSVVRGFMEVKGSE